MVFLQSDFNFCDYEIDPCFNSCEDIFCTLGFKSQSLQVIKLLSFLFSVIYVVHLKL